MTASEKRSAATRLASIFQRVHRYAQRKYKRTPGLSLYVGCTLVARHLREGNIRAVAHTGHFRGKVCASLRLAKLSNEFLVGIFLHEHGHHWALDMVGKSAQWHADRSVLLVTGIQIRYKGPRLLEWVKPAAVDHVLGRIDW